MNQSVTAPVSQAVRPVDTRFRRRLFYVRFLLKNALLLRRGYPLATYGDEKVFCHYTFCPEGLNSKSVIYSGGVGQDISFEHELFKNFGCNVILFDPSPIGLETMKLPKNNLPQFRLFPVGLAGKCG